MAPHTQCKDDQTPLEKAPFLYYEKLVAVLAVSEKQYGWKAIAKLKELAISEEKIRGIEESGTPVANFLRYLVFEHPKKDAWTVRWIEEAARKIHNTQIVKEFAVIKKEQCRCTCKLCLKHQPAC